MAESWKVSLPCTKAEAEALKEDIAQFAALDAPPVLMTSEADGEAWRMDAYFEAEPAPGDVALLLSLAPSAAGASPAAEKLGDEDWVTLSQAGLEPIHAGRFFVHTPAHRGQVPPGACRSRSSRPRLRHRPARDHHGCLIALDRLKATGASFHDLADIGTGTGLLAFAAMHLWPAARAAASDMDPVAIEVATENAALNHVRLGRARGQLETIVAPGLDHPRLKARAPYDLIIANILAGPLIDLAPALAGALAPGGRLVLAGLLDHQAEAVAAAYRRQSMMAGWRIDRGDWPTLVMRKRRATGWR